MAFCGVGGCSSEFGHNVLEHSFRRKPTFTKECLFNEDTVWRSECGSREIKVGIPKLLAKMKEIHIFLKEYIKWFRKQVIFCKWQKVLSSWNAAINSYGSSRERCVFKIQGTKTPFVLFHSPWKDCKTQPQDCVQHEVSSAVVLPCAQHVTHSLRTLTDKVDSHCQRAYITLDFLAIEKKK